MIRYPLSLAELADYVAVDQIVLDEIQVLTRPEAPVNELAASTDPQVRHFGDVIGGLDEGQVDQVMAFLAGLTEDVEDSQQREIAIQYAVRGFIIAARTSTMIVDNATFAERKLDSDTRSDDDR